MDKDHDYSFTCTNSFTPSPPSTPSAPATPDAITSGSSLYRARLIVENRLYDELLNRYRLATARLREVTREANALREENEWHRLENEDLTRRLHSLLSVTRESVSPQELSGSTTEQNNISEGGGSNSSMMSVVDEGDQERSFLPKSISVRSPGYFKLADLSLSSSPTPSRCTGTTPSQRRPNATKLRVRKEEKAIEMEVYKQGMYKTELCNKWEETGTCPYGQHCQFAHGVSELRPVIRHPRYKTQVCRMVLAGTACPYGHRCHFRHSLHHSTTSS